MNGEIDPLDAYMATLGVTISRENTTAAARCCDGLMPCVPAKAVTAKNRRLKRLQQLMQQQQTSSWYFSDSNMRERNPALYHFFVGQYLDINTQEQCSNEYPNVGPLSTFLMQSADRSVMEARRVIEQETWGAFYSHDTRIHQDNIEEEEEKEDEDTDDEDIDTRRQQLIALMSQRFLNGDDADYVDYSVIDADEELDDMEQIERDAEDVYFATDDE